MGLHSDHARLRGGHHGVGLPGTENVRLVGVDGGQEVVEELGLGVVGPGRLVDEEVGLVGDGRPRAVVETRVVENVGIRSPGHQASQTN